MKKRTSFTLICVLLFSLLLTTSCDLFQPQDQSSTPETTPTEAPSDIATPKTVTVASYEDVISIYRMAVAHLEEYYNLYPQEFADDMYAAEIANANDEVKHVYQSIFMPCFYLYMHEHGENYQGHGINAYGYTLFDINNNGTDELVLMTDECDLIAIFAMSNGKAKLVFNNPEGTRYYITADGSIKNRYQGERDTGFAYYEHTYTWNNDDTLTDAGESKAPINEFIYREELCAITKEKITSPFVRLSGPLTIQKPDIITWEWSDDRQPEWRSVELHIGAGSFTGNGFKFSLVYPNTLSNIVSNIIATREGDVAYFDTPEISGRIEFGYQSIWLIVEKSTVESIESYSYLLTYVTYSKG